MADDNIQVIDAAQLTAYLGGTTGVPGDSLDTFIELTNGLITDAWENPTDEIPTAVTSIALEVAACAARNPRGLASWTRSIDDGSRTERLPEQAARAGVYLLDHERAELGGRSRARRRFRTIRTRPGY